MSRLANADNEAALQAEHVLYTVAADLDFVSGMVRVHLGVGELTINGNTYVGVGTPANGGFGQISAVSERPDGRDWTQLMLGLSGVKPEYLALVPDRSQYFNRWASIYLLLFKPDTYELITPIEPAFFEGFMDSMSFERQLGQASISLTVKHFDSIYDQVIGRLYTDEHQQVLYANDIAFDQLTMIQDTEILWGAYKSTTGTQTPKGSPRGGQRRFQN